MPSEASSFRWLQSKFAGILLNVRPAKHAVIAHAWPGIYLPANRLDRKRVQRRVIGAVVTAANLADCDGAGKVWAGLTAADRAPGRGSPLPYRCATSTGIGRRRKRSFEAS